VKYEARVTRRNKLYSVGRVRSGVLHDCGRWRVLRGTQRRLQLKEVGKAKS